MITLGIILLVLGALLDVALMYSLGGILLVVGVVLYIAGRAGHAVAGRPHWY